MLDRTDLARAGGVGMGVRVTRRDGRGTPGPVRVSIDYSGFRYAHGGHFASRLHLVALPACALTTPGADGCSADDVTSLPVTNDVAAGSLTATVQADGDPDAGVTVLESGPRGKSAFLPPATGPARTGGTVYALVSGSSSDAGDYRASSLKPSGSWNVSTGPAPSSTACPYRSPHRRRVTRRPCRCRTTPSPWTP